MNDEYEYALKWKIHDTLSRLGSSENTFTQVYVYEPETIKLNTDHYFIEQYNRQRAPQKKLSRCLENRTRIESPMSEISDEEVDYGSYASNVDLVIAPGSWSPI